MGGTSGWPRELGPWRGLPLADTCEVCHEEEAGETAFWEKGKARGDGGAGSRWQRGLRMSGQTTLPTAHLRCPLAEANNGDMRGLTEEYF